VLPPLLVAPGFDQILDDDLDDVQIVESLTFDQALARRFEHAKVDGRFIDLEP
jgi:hypothetical protein